MTSKACFKCGAVLLLSEFYAHPRMADGHLNKCKTCTKRDVAARPKEVTRAYDRFRSKDPKRRAWARASKAAYNAAHPEQRAAWRAVQNAVAAGRLVRQPCSSCGAPEAEAHHDDYSRPLDIRWLCSACHRAHHAELRRTA